MAIPFQLDPVGPGFYLGWNAGAANFVLVNDANDGTFATTNGGGYQSYEMDDLPADATEVLDLEMHVRLSESTGRWNGIIHGYVRYNGALLGPLFSYHPTTGVVEQFAVVVKPGGDPWTPAEVNALEPVLGVSADEGFDYHSPNEGRNHEIWFEGNYNDVPPAPTNLTAIVTTSTQVDLGWTDNSTNETGFKVERADGPGGDFVQIATPAVNAVTYSDTTVASGILYTYRVRATNGSGDSLYTNLAVVSVGVVAPDQASFAKDGPNARFEVLQNVKNHGYRAGEYLGLMAIKFSIGAGEVGPVNFNPAAYDNATALAAAVQVAMRAAGSGNETCTYSNTTHLFTVGKAAGTLSLLIDTGDDAFKDILLWTKVLGFNGGVDKTGSLSYVADVPTFESADKDHILLASFSGFRDSGGEYTGSGSARIEIAPDVARCLIERWGPLPKARFNLPSFAAGRLHVPSQAPLFVWIQEKEKLEEILARIENSALAHVVMDSEGLVHYVPYSDTTVRRQFFDHDYLSFKVRKVKGNVYRGVRLHYGVHPHTGQYDSVEWTSDEAEMLYGGPRGIPLREVWTYIRDKPEAETAAAMHGALATAAPLEAEFEARSKLVDLKMADVIELNRERCAISPTGDLDAVRFKITELRHNKGTGISYAYAVEQIDLG